MKPKSGLEAMDCAIGSWLDIDLEDAFIAIQAAEQMSRKHGRDVAILNDLTTVFFERADPARILEVIRYDPLSSWH